MNKFVVNSLSALRWEVGGDVCPIHLSGNTTKVRNCLSPGLHTDTYPYLPVRIEAKFDVITPTLPYRYILIAFYCHQVTLFSPHTFFCHILFVSLQNNNTSRKPVQRIPIMETIQEEFQIRVYLKTELAQLYAPHLDPEAALRKMRKWIHRNADLYDQLYAGTEGKNEQAYSKRQVAIIVRYLDVP